MTSFRQELFYHAHKRDRYLFLCFRCKYEVSNSMQEFFSGPGFCEGYNFRKLLSSLRSNPEFMNSCYVEKLGLSRIAEAIKMNI